MTRGTLIILFLQLTSHSFKNIHFTHKNNISYFVNVNAGFTLEAHTHTTYACVVTKFINSAHTYA